jgi:multiple sugar transport system permease protein
VKKKGLQALYYCILWAVVFVFIAPIIWIAMSTFKSKADILALPPKFIFSPTMTNLVDLFSRPTFSKAVTNSLILTFSSVTIALFVSFLASYAFSRFKPRATDFFMFLLLSIRMVPAAASVVPLFLLYSNLGWKGTHYGIILFYAMFSIPFSVWILKGFLDGVSLRFDETAQVCGGGKLHTMFKIILPQIRPGLVSAFIFNLIFVWNEFLFGFIIGGAKVEAMPVTLATGAFTSTGIDWPFVASLSFFNLIPLIIVMFFFQKYLLVGMTFGTVRGEV